MENSNLSSSVPSRTPKRIQSEDVQEMHQREEEGRIKEWVEKVQDIKECKTVF